MTGCNASSRPAAPPRPAAPVRCRTPAAPIWPAPTSPAASSTWPAPTWPWPPTSNLAVAVRPHLVRRRRLPRRLATAAQRREERGTVLGNLVRPDARHHRELV